MDSQLHSIFPEKKNDDLVGNLIFIHGLGGHYIKTWDWKKSDDEHEFLFTWLHRDFPRLGIWSYSYTVNKTNFIRRSFGTPDNFSLSTQANVLLRQLTQNQLHEKPLMFITHSFGGLLVKNLLRASHDNQNENNSYEVSKKTKLVTFIATPHCGANLASVLSKIKGIVAASITIDELRRNADYLLQLQNWYRNNASRLDIQTDAYREHKGYGFLFLKALVVDECSADPGIPGVTPIPIWEDHIKIAKPKTHTEGIYPYIKTEIGNIVEMLPTNGSSDIQTNNRGLFITCEQPDTYPIAELIGNIHIDPRSIISSNRYSTRPVCVLRCQQQDNESCESDREEELKWNENNRIDISHINETTNYEIILSFRPLFHDFLRRNMPILAGTTTNIRWGTVSTTITLSSDSRKSFLYKPNRYHPMWAGELKEIN